MSELLSRLSGSLKVTQQKNEALLLVLEDSIDGGYETSDLVTRVQSMITECIKPNQTMIKELENLMKLFDSKLNEVRAQEKHNEAQVVTLEKERRDLINHQSSLDEQRRMLQTDKERAELKLDRERAELLERAERLTAMTKQIESGTEDLKRDVIYEAEKEKLKSELMLMKKIEEIKGLETMVEKYQEEIKRVGDDTRESIKISENQAIEACKRMEQMNNELIKSQDTARKLQHLLLKEKENSQELKAALDHERLQPISKHLQFSLEGQTIEGNLATIPGLTRALIQRAARAGNIPTALKVEEVLRRNELLKEENQNLRKTLNEREKALVVQRNDYKDASSRLYAAQMQANTLRQSRDDLLGKFKRTQQSYDQMNKSFTKQAASWVQEKLDERLAENDAKINRLLHKVS